SAVSWRQALEREPYLADAASFALAPTPPDQRTAVSAVFSAPPVDAAARQTLAALHLGWGDPFAAWRALRTLPPDDSSATSWLAARDALLAVLAVKPSLLVASRAANAALEAGDAAAALAATERVSGSEEPRAWAQLVLPVRVRALGALGRPADAAREVATSDADTVTRARLHREVAYAWVQSGDMSRAR